MALSDIKYVKPYHVQELITQHDAGGNWQHYTASVEVDITTEKASCVSDLNIAVDATTLSSGDKATLKVSLEAALNASFPYLLTVDAPIIDVLQTVKDNYDALVQTDGKTYACPECQRLGQFPVYDAEGTDTGDKQESSLCEGFGYTDVQYRRHPTQSGFITV